MCIHPTDETSNHSFESFHHKLISSVCSQKCSSGFTLTSLQFFAVLFHLTSHRISLDAGGLARLPGAEKFQDSLPFLSKVPPNQLCLQAGAESRECPGRSGAAQSPAPLLLQPEHFNPPNRTLRKTCSLWPKD